MFSETNTYDTWSLSYAPSDNVSRTTTVEKPPPCDEPVPDLRKYANLGPPGYDDNTVSAEDRLRRPSAPSPQVSALGSINQDDIPSRSISEVTRPDEQTRNTSPSGSAHSGKVSSGKISRTHTSETSPPAMKSTQGSRSVSLATLDAPSPPTGMARTPPVLRHTSDQNPHTASSGSGDSQPGTDAKFPPNPSETNTSTGDAQSRTESLSARPEPRRSMVSAVSSPSPGPLASDHGDISPAITRQSSTPARQNVEVAGEAPASLPSARSPPYDDATPPYSAAVITKEAEAAAEKSLEVLADNRQSLPP